LRKKSLEVLDLGCNDGAISLEIYKRGHKVTGVDFPEVLEHVKHEKIKFVPADISERLPFKNESFDVVFFLEVIEHLVYPTFTINEIKRVLRKNGFLILSTPNVASLRNRIFLLQGKHWQHENETDPQGHVQFFDKHKLINYLSNKGFEVLAISGASSYPVITEPLVEWMDKKFLNWVINFIIQNEDSENLKDQLVCLCRKI
jgi:2-polyprenyl-3-methyl-5-hydroxy-6-metoxy-1,4-benzoquinol methylase